jgi:hypothetical protein
MSGAKHKVGDKVIIRPGACEVPATIQEVQQRPDGDLYVVYVGKYEPTVTIKEGCILRLR